MANTDLTRWNPMDDLRQMQRFMDRFWFGYPRVNRDDVEFATLGETLPVDIYEKDNTVIVKAALPGVDPKDIDVNVADGVLTIKAETRAEENVEEGDYHRQEYRYGTYSRAFRLPENLDTANATAAYENGMLRLTFPRTEAAKAKTIHLDVK